MIHIRKGTAPAVLLTRGVLAVQAHCDEHAAAPAEYRSGDRTFEFNAKIYAAEEVKDALRTAQHGKCAFCESSFVHIAYGDIEHFRPKGGYQQRDTDKLRQPGYFWLAYEWSNLFYSCQLCNQQFKRNLFPLKDGRRRANPRTRNTANEEPLLVDPGAREPTDFIGFENEYAFPVDKCAEGVATIEALGLNREDLAELRRRRLQDLRILRGLCAALRKLAASDPEHRAQLREYEAELQARTTDAAEYAAMARAFLAAA